MIKFQNSLLFEIPKPEKSAILEMDLGFFKTGSKNFRNLKISSICFKQSQASLLSQLIEFQRNFSGFQVKNGLVTFDSTEINFFKQNFSLFNSRNSAAATATGDVNLEGQGVFTLDWSSPSFGVQKWFLLSQFYDLASPTLSNSQMSDDSKINLKQANLTSDASLYNTADAFYHFDLYALDHEFYKAKLHHGVLKGKYSLSKEEYGFRTQGARWLGRLTHVQAGTSLFFPHLGPFVIEISIDLSYSGVKSVFKTFSPSRPDSEVVDNILGKPDVSSITNETGGSNTSNQALADALEALVQIQTVFYSKLLPNEKIKDIRVKSYSITIGMFSLIITLEIIIMCVFFFCKRKIISDPTSRTQKSKYDHKKSGAKKSKSAKKKKSKKKKKNKKKKKKEKVSLSQRRVEIEDISEDSMLEENQIGPNDGQYNRRKSKFQLKILDSKLGSSNSNPSSGFSDFRLSGSDPQMLILKDYMNNSNVEIIQQIAANLKECNELDQSFFENKFKKKDKPNKEG